MTQHILGVQSCSPFTFNVSYTLGVVFTAQVVGYVIGLRYVSTPVNFACSQHSFLT